MLFPLDNCFFSWYDSLLVSWLSSSSKPGQFNRNPIKHNNHQYTILLKNKPAPDNLIKMIYLPVQPIQLSDSLNCLLLSMCEDMAHRRANLNSILEACESHHKASLLPPPNKVIKQLVEDVFQDSVSPIWSSKMSYLTNWFRSIQK